MNRRRIPFWLKLGYTIWVAVWVPLYWLHYGPQNFLWFCDIANILLAVALWRESRLLVSSQAVSVLLVQIVYTVDLLGRLALGTHLVGGTEYMFNPAIPLGIRLLSLFHVAMPPLLVWMLSRLGYDRRGLVWQIAVCWLVLPLSYLFGPELNINWVWGPFGGPQEAVAPGVYLLACFIAYPLLLYLPSHAVLSRLPFPKRAVPGGSPARAS